LPMTESTDSAHFVASMGNKTLTFM
jgi:hypothetical protein